MLNSEDYCDYCKHPDKHKCYEKCYCVENYPPHECCEDNLKKNVGEICFKYNVPQNVAVAIIKILEKERERNECMYVHREYITQGGLEKLQRCDIDEVHSCGEQEK